MGVLSPDGRILNQPALATFCGFLAMVYAARLHVPTLEPLDAETIEREAARSGCLVFVAENHSTIGACGGRTDARRGASDLPRDCLARCISGCWSVANLV